MSRMVVTLAVDNVTLGDEAGIKEAIAMDMEKYGSVRILGVEVQGPEQLSIGSFPGAKKGAVKP